MILQYVIRSFGLVMTRHLVQAVSVVCKRLLVGVDDWRKYIYDPIKALTASCGLQGVLSWNVDATESAREGTRLVYMMRYTIGNLMSSSGMATVCVPCAGTLGLSASLNRKHMSHSDECL